METFGNKYTTYEFDPKIKTVNQQQSEDVERSVKLWRDNGPHKLARHTPGEFNALAVEQAKNVASRHWQPVLCDFCGRNKSVDGDTRC